MDGVLVDTYRAHYRSWLEMAEPEGIHFTEAEFAPTFGRTSREIIAHFWGKDRYDDAQIAELDRRKEAAFRRAIEADFPAMPGVDELAQVARPGGLPARRRIVRPAGERRIGPRQARRARAVPGGRHRRRRYPRQARSPGLLASRPSGWALRRGDAR